MEKKHINIEGLLTYLFGKVNMFQRFYKEEYQKLNPEKVEMLKKLLEGFNNKTKEEQEKLIKEAEAENKNAVLPTFDSQTILNILNVTNQEIENFMY